MTTSIYKRGDRIELIPGEFSVVKAGEFEILGDEGNGLHRARYMDTGYETCLSFERIRMHGGVLRKLND